MFLLGVLTGFVATESSHDSRRRRPNAQHSRLLRALWLQQQAITNLERSLAQGRPRALIQVSTGSGKTFNAVNSIYRLIKHADARRVLFAEIAADLQR